jgi:hypothetical protein
MAREFSLSDVDYLPMAMEQQTCRREVISPSLTRKKRNR